MSTSNGTDKVTPKVAKYGRVPKLVPLRLRQSLLFYSTTRELWAESQPNHLGFVVVPLDECSICRGAHRRDTALGCMSYGSSKWQEWILGEKEGMEHIKFA